MDWNAGIHQSHFRLYLVASHKQCKLCKQHFRFIRNILAKIWFPVPAKNQLFIFNTTLYFQHNFFNCNTTFCFQHNFLFSTQLFIFNTTFYFQHNFLFSTQLFIFNTTFYFQHNFFYPTAIHSCHVSRARTFFEKSCKNVVKL